MFTPRLRANNGEGLRQAALAGVGIVMQPEVLLADDVREKRRSAFCRLGKFPRGRCTWSMARDRQMTPNFHASLSRCRTL